MHIQSYIQAAVETLEKGVSPVDVLARLKELLKKHGRYTSYKRIVRSLYKHMTTRDTLNKTVIELARESDLNESIAHIHSNNDPDIKNKTYEVKIKPELIGGYVLKNRNNKFDASFKKKLLATYHRIIST